MSWYQPDTSIIPDLSNTCIVLVFLVYLLRLKQKSVDCYLVILIYASSLPVQAASCLTDILAVSPPVLFGILFFFQGLHMLSVIWCSYRFYELIFPRECRAVIAVYGVLFAVVMYLWLAKFIHFHRVTVWQVLPLLALYMAAVSLGMVNYFRKMKLVWNSERPFTLKNALLRSPSREVALFGGFALSLVLYLIIELFNILSVMELISVTMNILVIYYLSVAITVVVGFAYFNYAREESSFETKLVGITLFLTLSVITTISIILFGPFGTPATIPFLTVFIWIVPLTTLLLTLLLPLLLRVTLLRPLGSILAGVKQVTSGDLNAEIDLEVNDELGRVSQNFNRMTASLRQRTEQLASMRETIATDFHDQTGNMLSAITRQAGLLKLKLGQAHELQPIVKTIVENSNSLYASSKDFLWQLNHDSDDPNEVFAYLTAQGQVYFNQFDMAFSAGAEHCQLRKFEPSAALNLIFIFKEAMTNVVKHAGATEVTLNMACAPEQVTLTLEDNGTWKEADSSRAHYGLSNMERRCRKNNFTYLLTKENSGTWITITVPVYPLNDLA